MARVVRVTRTVKTVRGKRYRDYYVKVYLPERVAERVEAYLVEIHEATGRIVLHPLPRQEDGDQHTNTGYE